MSNGALLFLDVTTIAAVYVIEVGTSSYFHFADYDGLFGEYCWRSLPCSFSDDDASSALPRAPLKLSPASLAWLTSRRSHIDDVGSGRFADFAARRFGQFTARYAGCRLYLFRRLRWSSAVRGAGISSSASRHRDEMIIFAGPASI